MSRKAGTPNKPKETSRPMGELDTVDEPREVATKYENPIEGNVNKDFQPGYIITQSDKPDALIMHVNGFIEIGYQCQGGISVTSWRDVNGIEYLYSQAMVRKEM